MSFPSVCLRFTVDQQWPTQHDRGCRLSMFYGQVGWKRVDIREIHDTPTCQLVACFAAGDCIVSACY